MTDRVLNKKDFISMYSYDPEKVLGLGFEDEWTGFEIFMIESYQTLWTLMQEEVALLTEQFPDDKNVQEVLELIDTEGLWYTVVHKTDVGLYLGSTSTLACLAMQFKACDRTFTKWVHEADNE